MPKSQTAMEFLFLCVIAFMVSVVFAVVTLNQQKELDFQKEYILVKDLSLKAQGEIMLASNVEDGYYRVFEIPNILGNLNYTIGITNSTFLVVQSKNDIVISTIPEVNGTIKKGGNIIRKNEGKIILN